MKIDLETLQKIAHLARLKFEEGKAEAMMADMSKILDWVEKLNEVDTEGVEPLIHITEELNVLRPDEPKEALERKKALQNAPKHNTEYFRVPKVLD
jgi:aspartyl-tRNA(Asn)/glutamyl-tRNA(Gln) amidotransferase subunit C